MSKCVLIAEFSHETNTFSVQPADLAAFERRLWHVGPSLPEFLRYTNTEVAGFFDCADQFGWTLVHAISAAANPSGPVTQDVWERVAEALRTSLDASAQVDGVLLALHGAMVADLHSDAETALLSLVRDIVGETVPVAVTFDLHANLGRDTARFANIVCSYRTYPHVDMRDCGREAGELLERAMTTGVVPVSYYASRPMLQGADGGRTDVEPMISLLEKARHFENEPGCLRVSINAGFCHADVAETGPSVVVTAERTSERFQQMAEQLMDDIWDTRDVVNNTYLPVREAAEIALASAADSAPIVIADYADNPGAGSYGDATNLLRAMLDVGVRDACFGGLRDPDAVQVLMAAGQGAEVAIEIGGKTDPTMGGGPLRVTGKVLVLSDGQFVYDGPMWAGMSASLGPTAVLRVDGVDVMLTSNLQQIVDIQQFRANGVEPLSKRVIGLKSMQHFRAAYEPIASRVLVCDSGALASPDLARLDFNNVRRPIHPLDEC